MLMRLNSKKLQINQLTMYMPRRTTEFREEARNDVSGSCNKRPTRSHIRSFSSATPLSGKALPGTNKRPSASRMAQPLCLERDRASQMCANTPNRRLASSVERSVPHHTDKKWVAEKSQALVEYLHAMQSVYAIQGVSNEFFQRSGCLRQMTMKQFVGIVNFFFLHIWRHRVTVNSASNVAAEDIMGALSKLKYPYQINKSSLMTPTTQHSFGHIIVMLSFLRDLAPDPPSDQIDENEFLFMETAEQFSMASDSTMSTTQNTHQIRAALLLDEELNGILFSHAPECFHLWDQRSEEKEAQLKSKARDIVIGKKCGQQITDSVALETDIQSLVNKLQQLEQEVEKALDKKKLQQLNQLQQEQKHLENEIKCAWMNAKDYEEEVKQMVATSEQRDENIVRLSEKLQSLQEMVNRQKFTTRQLSELQVQYTDRQHVNEVYERNINDGNERALNQQVMLSRSKKKLLDKVELFNTHVRMLAQEQHLPHQQHLELSLSVKPQSKELPDRRARLDQLADHLRQLIPNHQQQIQQLERQKHNFSLGNIKLESELSEMKSRLKAQEQQLAQLELSYHDKRLIADQSKQVLIEQKYELAARIEELRLTQQEAIQLLESKIKLNCGYLDAAESYQTARIKARQDYCDAYEKKLNSTEKQLDAIHLTIAQNNPLLEQAKQQLKDTQLPSLERTRANLLQ